MTDKKGKSKGGSGGSSNEDEDDGALWAAAMDDVKPLKGRKVSKAKSVAPRAAKTLSPAGPLPGVDVTRKQQKQVEGEGLDRNTDEKLRRGKMPIEAKLDLHGMTQDEAFAALGRFVIMGYDRGLRCVLVVTGKGKEGTGVLKNAIPGWLASPKVKPFILQTHPAKPHHGGSGALYVLLRRKRK
jgi:DNA-nicking Smr family endonuclease